jgi:hypothetical protein
MSWAEHVARMREKRNGYRILVGKLEGKRPLGRPRRRCFLFCSPLHYLLVFFICAYFGTSLILNHVLLKYGPTQRGTETPQ